MELHTLTELQYAEPEKDGSYKLYIYGRDGYHSGAKWFRNKVKYPDEEITSEEARKLVKEAMGKKKEIRITDGGDNIVYHAANGAVLYPDTAEDFWSKI